MKHNIQKLLTELTDYTFNSTGTISDDAQAILAVMRSAISALEQTDNAKQQKMITLFMGGTILAMNLDQRTFDYNPPLCSGDAVNDVTQGENVDVTPDLLIQIGNAAFIDLSTRFNVKMFEEERLLNTSKTAVAFFPLLKQNSKKIDILVQFCIKHSRNLEHTEMEIVDDADLATDNNPAVQTVAPPPLTASPSSAGGASGGDDDSADSKENRDTPTTPPSPKPSISMQILSGFMMALGASAVAIAFAALNAATLALAGVITASLGTAALLGGVGLFAYGRCCRKDNDVSLEHSGLVGGLS